MPPNSYNDDEAVARALQEQFERESNQRQSSTQSSTRSSNQRRLQPSAPPEAVVRGQRLEETDEQYARRIAKEEERLYQYYQKRQSQMNRESNRNNNGARDTGVNRAPQSHNISSRARVYEGSAVSYPAFDVKRTGSDETPETSQDGSDVAEYEDAEYARRIEQELQDEDLARRIQQTDEQRASQHAARYAATQPEPRPCWTFSCFCRYLICFTIVGAGIVAFMYFFYIQDNDLPGKWIFNPEDFAEEDPFDAKGPADISPWRSDGNGLRLEVVNSLDDVWHPFFYEAILDWDNGYPDTLTLRTTQMNPDSDCSEIFGKVRVCNGDYGKTSWKGICVVHINPNGYIYASTARLNDHYFNGNSGSMQYTMCHELGHAWGLPHTDETFGNRDLGNCMDYTHNEDANKRPDISNYDFLYQLYGLVPGADPYDPPTAAPTVTPAPTMAPLPQLTGSSQQTGFGNQPEKETGKNEKNGKDRSLSVISESEFQAALADARDRIMSGSTHGVRLIHKGVRGEVHETDVINGHKLRIHTLLPHV